MLSDIIKVLLVATSLLFTSSSYSQSLFPYLKGDLYGFADSTGKVIVEPVYEQITHHGYTTFFSEMHDPKRRKYQDKDWPEELALGYTDGKWHLLDKHCNSILKEGTKGKIKVSSWSTTSPYLVITTDSITDGWGIWNANTGETEGLVYYYGKAGRDMSGNTIFKDSDDLNPFRGGCQELYASIKDSVI